MKTKYFMGKTSLITLNLSQLLQEGTQILKSVDLGYPSFRKFQSQLSVRIFC
jgi:hypothetical protein